MLLIFAGKAHPADEPGQDLIRRISQIAHMPEFEGRLLLIEGYDLRLARRLVSGVDIWLNNPIYPLEASGTSGIKAGINGSINLSILDGWWEEGYDGNNGWAIKPGPENMEAALRDQDESQALYEILQDQGDSTLLQQRQIRLFTGMGKKWLNIPWHHYCPDSVHRVWWMNICISFIIRQVTKIDFTHRIIFQAHWRLPHGKQRIRQAWQNVTIRSLDLPRSRAEFNEVLHFKVAAQLNGLKPEDVVLELLICRQFRKVRLDNFSHYNFEFTGIEEHGEHIFELKLSPELCGKQEYFVRIYPYHALLTHPLEMGMMVWL